MKFCPGQDTQFWKFEDIFDVHCPNCKSVIEFFKNDVKRKCPDCDKVVFNPKLDLGCAAWCPVASNCVGPERVKEFKKSSQQKKGITSK